MNDNLLKWLTSIVVSLFPVPVVYVLEVYVWPLFGFYENDVILVLMIWYFVMTVIAGRKYIGDN